MDQKAKLTFDDIAKESAQHILENFWILREERTGNLSTNKTAGKCIEKFFP